MNRIAYTLAIVSLVLTTMCVVAHGQATGSISGSVVDPSGAVIAKAKVQLTQTETNQTRDVVTDAAGHYVANLLPLGNYKIQVSASDFQSVEETGILLEAQGSPEVNFKLTLGTVSSNVLVQATAVEVQTATSSMDQVIHSQQVADLPLNGRNFVELATLAPGVSQGDQPTDFFAGGPSSSSETSIRGTFSLSVGGSRENRTDWLYDGIDDSELTSGAIGVMPSIDALQEFNVLTSNYSAEYGTRAGPTVLLISKSGSNAFHGTLFDFLRNTKPECGPILLSSQSGIYPEPVRRFRGRSNREEQALLLFRLPGNAECTGRPFADPSAHDATSEMESSPSLFPAFLKCRSTIRLPLPPIQLRD